MKLKHVGMIVVSVLAMSSAAVSAAEGDESVTTTVNGGVIHFKGEVVNAACAIDSESKVAIRHLKLKQGVCGMATHTRAIYQYSSHF